MPAAAKFDLLIRHGGSAAALRTAVQADPALRAEAEAELAALRGIHPDRCVMTVEYTKALREALA